MADGAGSGCLRAEISAEKIQTPDFSGEVFLRGDESVEAGCYAGFLGVEVG